MAQKVLVFGKFGQVSRSIQLLDLNSSFIYLDSEQANFLDLENLYRILDFHCPDLIVNASAYTQVDRAELNEEREKSLIINGRAPGVIANWCQKNGATLIHYSTDYIFDGSGEEPWFENSRTSPINWYGKTKLEGEIQILNSGAKAFILRISWVYSPWGQNFPLTILRLAKEREVLKVVDDQWGAPTDARLVGQTTYQLIKKIFQNKNEKSLINNILNCGIYHLRYAEYENWFLFAKRIIEDAQNSGETLKIKELIPIKTKDFPTPATRPLNSRLGSNYQLTELLNKLEVMK
jgi:dTDP-4-dehydrorhamnose reductase